MSGIPLFNQSINNKVSIFKVAVANILYCRYSMFFIAEIGWTHTHDSREIRPGNQGNNIDILVAGPLTD